MGKEKILTEGEMLAKYLPDEAASTMSEAIDTAVTLSLEFKAIEKRLGKYKAFFRKTVEPGEQVNGKSGYVLLVSAKVTTAEGGELHQLLKDVGREQEFYPLIKVKIADARKVLGTTLFAKISTEAPGVPGVSLGELELSK